MQALSTARITLILTLGSALLACGKQAPEPASPAHSNTTAATQTPLNARLQAHLAKELNMDPAQVPAYIAREQALMRTAETLHVSNAKGHSLVLKFYQRPLAKGQFVPCVSVQTPKSQTAIELRQTGLQNGLPVYSGQHVGMRFSLTRQGSIITLTENGRASVFQ